MVVKCSFAARGIMQCHLGLAASDGCGHTVKCVHVPRGSRQHREGNTSLDHLPKFSLRVLPYAVGAASRFGCDVVMCGNGYSSSCVS